MNGCDSHMAAAEPGCANCFHRLMGRYDAQKSESLRNHHAWCSVEELLKEREAKLAAANLQIDELKLDLKESGADADALILLSKGLYERIQGKPDWVVASSCQTALNYIDYVNRLNGEMRLALEIAKPSTIHVLSGHVYGPDDRLAEFVDGCARCRIERILQQTENRKGEAATEDGFEVLTTYKNSTAKCPCGSQFTWEGFDENLGAWRDDHRPHLRR